MRIALTLVLLLSLAACGGGGDESLPAADTAALKEQGRTATNKLQMALKQELSRAIQEGGAANALTVCNVQALPIAQDVSEELGVTVGRVSRRNRSPHNAPDERQRAVLAHFEQADAPGDTVLTLDDGRRLYLRPIFISSPLCLHCHGSEEARAEGVDDRLASLYPEDQAVGYQEGELRGAFTVLFPAAE